MQEFYKRMQQLLLEEKDKLKQSLATEQADFHDMIDYQEIGDVSDEVSQTLDKQIIEAIGSQTALMLQRIDAALARIDNGIYGICGQCGKMIAKERLEAIPEALLCIDCQTHHK